MRVRVVLVKWSKDSCLTLRPSLLKPRNRSISVVVFRHIVVYGAIVYTVSNFVLSMPMFSVMILYTQFCCFYAYVIYSEIVYTISNCVVFMPIFSMVTLYKQSVYAYIFDGYTV